MVGRLSELRRRPWVADLAWAGLLAVVVCGPMLTGRGFALLGDMVFVPDQPWKSAWLGADGTVPRAVPSDAIASVVTTVLPGDLLQKAILVGIVLGAALGMSRLLGDLPTWPRLAAATLFVWNPFVAERLAIGHWALLVGYAALPWTAYAARRAVEGRSWTGLVLCLTVAAWTSPTGGVLAFLVALVWVLLAGGGPWRSRWRRGGLAWGIGLLVNLPWIVPGFASAGSALPPDPLGVSAFAARADTPYGVLGSLVTFGGLWKESVDPTARASVALVGASLLLTAAGAAGLWAVRRTHTGPTRAFVALGGLGLLLALAPATAIGAEATTWLVTEVPGGGLLRDSHKWIALLALAVCWGLGHLLSTLADRFGTAHARWWAVAAAVVPVAVLPGLAWGLLGTLAPTTYPDTWGETRTAMERSGADQGRVAVLPFGLYRRYAWNDERAVLDPAPRFFPGRLLVDDSLEVGGGTVGGERADAARIRAVVGNPDDLTRVLGEEGIGWVLVDLGSGVSSVEPAGEVVHENSDFRLIRVGPSEPAGRPSTVVLATDAAVVLSLIVIITSALRRPRTVYSPRREHNL